jgi:hypothetical protein
MSWYEPEIFKNRTFTLVVCLFLSVVGIAGGISAVVTQEATTLRSLEVYTGEKAIYLGILFIIMGTVCFVLSIRKYRMDAPAGSRKNKRSNQAR